MRLIPKLLRDQSWNTLLRGSGAAFAINALGALLIFGVELLLARTLQVEGFGIYVYVLSWITILLLPSTVGFDSAILRFLPALISKGKHAEVFALIRMSSLVGVGASVCVGAVLIGVTWSQLVAGDLRLTFWVASALLPVLVLTMLRQASLRALKRITFARSPEMIVRPLLLGTIVLIWWWSSGQEPVAAWQAMLAHVVAAAIAFALGAYFLRNALNALSPQAEPTKKRAPIKRVWITTAFSLLLVSSMHVLLNEVDKIMIGLLSDVKDVGIYGVAARLSFFALFGLQAINSIAVPLISECYARQTRDELQSLVRKVAGAIFLISMPLAFAILIFGNEVLGLFGEEFVGAYYCLVFLLVGQCVNFAVGPVGFLLTMTGHERIHLRILVVSLIINVTLNVPAIFYFGIEGAAVATGLAIAIRNLLAWQQVREKLQVEPSVYGVFKRTATISGKSQ